MDGLMKVLREISDALDSDNPQESMDKLLLRKQKQYGIPMGDLKAHLRQSIEPEIGTSQQLIMDMCGITCIMYLRLDEVDACMDNILSKGQKWCDENHNCNESGDHTKYLREMLIWARIETERFLGVTGEKGIS